MITTENYFDYIKNVDVPSLPENLQKGHEFVHRATKGGTTWDAYKSEKIREVMDTYFKKLYDHTKGKQKEIPAIKRAKDDAKNYKNLSTEKLKMIQCMEHDAEMEDGETEEIKIRMAAVEKELRKRGESTPVMKSKPGKITSKYEGKKQVERFPEEFRFIRRFVNLNGKTKTSDQILNFINGLQRSITEKRIEKTSPYKKEIEFIQDTLIRNYNRMKGKIKVQLEEKTILDFKKILGEEVIYPSVQFIKRFIGLHGKTGVKEKAKKLLATMNRAMKKGVFTSEDKYFSKLNEVHRMLEKFVSTPGIKTLSVEPAQLNGLMGILGECGCMHDDKKPQDFSGIEYGGRSAQIMNSMDFATLRFNTIGFKGKWKDFIGDPTPGFSMMVYARPKMGKSYLCVDFAGYLARNHGKVLYVAREEGLDYTLQQKLNDKDVKHPNLYVSSYLPDDLAEYDFIILDSVNKLGLSPKDLEILRRKNPGKSFVFIFQTTKDGVFRGNNEYQHDVDVVVDIPEKGKAVQFGRFNQGGEMGIFNS